MEAICDLGGILAPSVPAHHPNREACFFIQTAALSWSRSGNRSTTRWLSKFDFDGPEPVTAPEREIVYPQLDDLSGWKIRQSHHLSQDRLARDADAEPCSESGFKIAAGRQSNRLKSGTQSGCHPGPRQSEGGHALCKDFALTQRITAKEFAHSEEQLDLASATRNIA